MGTSVHDKIRPELGTVQGTLVLPLIGRATMSRRFGDFFSDAMAEDIVDRLDFDRGRARRYMGEAGMLAMAVRARKMDQAIRSFVYRHPYATVLNIGAGLDTAFWRVDNGHLRWIDLDLPDSIDLRRRFLPESERNRHVAKSMFDYSWIDDLGDVSEGLFIQVPGVLPYMDLADVKGFFMEIAPRLPGAEIIFDVISPTFRYFVNRAVQLAGMRRTRMDWGIADAREMAGWSPHMEVVSQEPYFRGIDRSLWPTTRIAMEANDLLAVAQFFHLRFT